MIGILTNGGAIPPAAILWQADHWLAAVSALLVIAIGAIWLGYRGQRGRGWVVPVGMALKAAGIILVLLSLLEPMRVVERARSQANEFALMVDASRSMTISDPGASRSRGEEVKEALIDDRRTWIQTLERDFRVRRYEAGAHLQPVADFSALAFDRRSSALAAALREVAGRYQDRPLAGILLFTDGNLTDAGTGNLPWSELPPVYPVVVGSSQSRKDVALRSAAVRETAFEDAPVGLQAQVSAPGYFGETIEVAVRNRHGAVVESQRQSVDADESMVFRFKLKPESTGLEFYRISAVPVADRDRFEAGKETEEATLLNNSRFVPIRRRAVPFRILYVSGRPNWEFKFLNRAVAEDPQLHLVGLIRLAQREPKFTFKGRPGESTNPLYRGFGRETEDIEAYDQPVLKRLNIRDEFELQGGFPRLAEELFAYHAILIGKVEADFFTQDQMQLLQKFVGDRGGGLMMMGGLESFREGGYNRTPIGKVLPVYLDDSPSPPLQGPLQLRLTREGWLQPWIRLRPNESEETERLSRTDGFRVLNYVSGIRPGASLLAEVYDPQGNAAPALAVQRFGRGRTAALMVGDLWRWGMQDAERHRDMDRAWRQLLRWLVADVPEQVELEAEADDSPDNGNTVLLRVRVRDAQYEPLDQAQVELSVTPVGDVKSTADADRPVVLTTEPAAERPGTFEARFTARKPGAYRAKAVARDNQGNPLGSAEFGWYSDPAAGEFDTLVPNRTLMRQIAAATGGEVIDLDGLDDLARRLPSQKAPIMARVPKPLWNTWPVLLAALACFLAEWGLRRWKGMA